MTTELPETAAPEVALTTGADLDHGPLAPSISSPEAPSREQLRAERALSATVEVWLAHQALPEQAVVWYPHWDDWRPVVVEDRAHLVRLITQLEEDEFAGVKLRPSKGPWAQVMNGGDGEFCIELHPHTHGDRPGGMFFERVAPVSASAGALGWAWVRRDELPSGYQLEPRVVPEGSVWDLPL